MSDGQVVGNEPSVSEGLRQRVQAYERRLILEALRQSGGNQRRAAQTLRCLPTTLNEKMRRLGLRGQDVWAVAPVAEEPPIPPNEDLSPLA